MREYVELLIAQTKASVMLHEQQKQRCEEEDDQASAAYHLGVTVGGYRSLNNLRAILDRCPVVQATNHTDGHVKPACWSNTLVSASNDDGRI